MAETEILNVSFQKVINASIKLGCEKLSLIKKTKKGRIHFIITPIGNKTKIKIHHDIFTSTGHYSKSKDPDAKKFLNDLKKELNI